MLRRIHKKIAAAAAVEVAESRGVRSLHLGTGTVQSAMRLANPDALELSYARSMMSFLLFATPRRMLQIGLGGGSLAKFIYRHLPETAITSVEINPEVIAAARSFFFLPPDDERLSVIQDDGAVFVASVDGRFDGLILDAFDGHAQPESLSSEAFYRGCASALNKYGVFVANLWRSDKAFERNFEHVRAAFEERVLCLDSTVHRNMIVLAFKSSQGNPRWEALRERAKMLEQRLGIDFPSFVERLRGLNASTDKRLLI